MKRILIPLLIAVLLCLALAAAAEGDVLAFDPGEIQVNVGDTLQATLIREGDAAGGEVVFASSNKETASVDQTGLVTALKKGKVTITATVKGTKKTYKAQMKLTIVKPVSEIVVNTDKLSVFSAEDEKVAPYLSKQDNEEENNLPVIVLPVKKRIQLTISAEPKDASNRKVTLTSGNPDLFTAKDNTITGIAPGDSVLVISSQSNPEITASFRVLVVQPVTKLTVESSAPFVTVGGQAAVTAKATPDNATIQQVTWSSGSEKLLSVDPATGMVTGLKRGNGRIIATATDGSNVRANYNLKVVQNPENITLGKTDLVIDIGKTASVKATVEPKDTDNKKLIWFSSDESIATVDKTGRIKAVGLGECTISCACEAKEDVTASVNVLVQQPVKKVAFNEKSTYCYVGETAQLAWTITPDNATNPTLEFKSTNSKILTVDEKGLVTGIKKGKANVQAVTTDGSKRKASIQVRVGEHVSAVHMRRKHAYIDVGETATAGAVIEPKDAINRNMSWFSSDENIVTANGKTNEKMKLKGIRRGDATVTGITEDGGFDTSIKVTVGDYDHGISFRKLSYDKNAYFWLEVRNETDLTITSITAEVEMFDASQSGSPALPINKKNGKNKVNLVWNGKLRPGETTGKKNWKMQNFELKSLSVSDTKGTVTLCSYQIDNDWIKTIRQSHRPKKKFGY